MGASIYIPINSVGGFPFFSILSPAFVICGLFDDSQSDWCEVVRMVVVFICISLRINDVEHLLMFLLDICMSV